MSFIKSRPIPLIGAGPERELMACFLERVKRIKGSTTCTTTSFQAMSTIWQASGSSGHPVLGVCIGAGTVEARNSF